MRISEWRLREGLTLTQLAGRIGLAGKNPARTMQRYETGESPVDAAIGEHLIRESGGLIRPQDLHDQRLEWLRANSAGSVRSLGAAS